MIIKHATYLKFLVQIIGAIIVTLKAYYSSWRFKEQFNSHVENNERHS